MRKPTFPSLLAHLSSKNPKLFCSHYERLSSCVEAVDFLFAAYATDENIARAVKYLESYNQTIGMETTEFAKIL